MIQDAQLLWLLVAALSRISCYRRKLATGSIKAVATRAPNNYFMVPRWGPLIHVPTYPGDQAPSLPVISACSQIFPLPEPLESICNWQMQTQGGVSGERGRFIQRQRGERRALKLPGSFHGDPRSCEFGTFGLSKKKLKKIHKKNPQPLW